MAGRLAADCDLVECRRREDKTRCLIVSGAVWFTAFWLAARIVFRIPLKINTHRF